MISSGPKFLPSAALSLFCWLSFLALFLFRNSSAQNATLDPSEARALNSLFQQWDVQPRAGLWNISGEPCTGTSINATELEDSANNPSIKCNCSFEGGTTCHIIQMRVQALKIQGIIPKVLTAFTYLEFLKIDKNYFTGLLPAFIGNLIALRILSISHNAFSGPIPPELGRLTALTMLSLGSNNFSGTLPPELGDLVNLELIYMDSCGAGGEIPSTFAKLRNTRVMWASDSPFTGKIPDFIGSWTQIIDLRFQGNSFEGPIPSSFSNLTSLTSLRISDIYNVSSSLDFIRDLKNLTDLVLRNALISGGIPTDIGEYRQLQTLDLSFNNLTGPIPPTLFNLTSLASLLLGNNSLSGPLPSQKSGTLQTVDLSYNELSGNLPSWVTPNSQVNLVANNFTLDSSNRTVLPGLYCLQRDFPCNRGSPLYANFAINCGGPARSAEGILYEAENSASFGPASYYMGSTEKWAVSNVGIFSNKNDPVYTATTSAYITGTSTPELFQTSRMSAASLRYYGLGLENGDYNVSLLFAETIFSDRSTRTWESLGRRVFDIYIQGTLQLKDFDISQEAGGVKIALQKNFNATVTQNYLEIHLFWAGKGTCCLPNQGDYGPFIAALSVALNFTPPTKSKKNRTGLIVGVVVSVGVISIILLFSILYWKKKGSHVEDEEDLLGIGPRPNTYTYAELRTATGDFSPSNKLGEGGFGPVYKGTLNDGRIVAVKQLSVGSHQGKSQFIAEIATISAVQHRNLVKLYGCCIEGSRRLLVYEFLEHKSLDQALFGNNNLHLDWPTRFSICLGTARGLAYLHEESRPRIVHRDVKASNILLDSELSPKISDFGLAKLYDDKKTHISTRIAGTIGYLAPEYAMRGHLTEKADVFGFGVVCLEILSGRPNSDDSLDSERKYLLEWAWNLHENNQSLDLVDPTLEVFDENEAIRLIGVALLCTQASPMMRPPMSRVIAMLAGDIEVSTATTKPSYLTDWDFKDITDSFLDGETPSSAPSNSSSPLLDNKVDNPSDTNTNAVPSPINLTETMLHEIIGEGR